MTTIRSFNLPTGRTIKSNLLKNLSITFLGITIASSTFANSPYSGSPVSLPGTIQAENYDFGGNGNSYYDDSPGNTGGAYRNDSVDIESSQGGGYNIGWISPGEWLEYTVEVTESGEYEIASRVASNSSGGSLYYEAMGATTARSQTISFGNTGGWQNWQTASAASFYLNPGEHIIRVTSAGGGFNLDKITVTKQGGNNNGELQAYPGYTGTYNGFTLQIDDRFDSFDPALWTKSTHTFSEPGCIFEPRGVKFNDGVMNLTIDHSNNWKGFYCGEIRSNQKYSYGRIEARIKNPPTEVASGYISSLFTYVFRPLEDQGDNTIHWRELDVEMEGGRPNKFQANLIFGDGVWQWWETGYWGRYEDKITIGPTSEWKVYALEWTEQYIRWYIDGVLFKELTQHDLNTRQYGGMHSRIANIPEFKMGLFMNFWIPKDSIQNEFGGNKYRNVYPMTASYDWFRYYSCDNCPSSVD